MDSRRLHIFRALVALVVVYIAVVSRVPTSKCRCKESKPVAAEKAPCPFGEARLLAQITLLNPIIEAPQPVVTYLPFRPTSPARVVVPSTLTTDARAPPSAPLRNA